MIYLPQYFIRKSETIQAPVVTEHVRFVEVLVRALENSEGNPIHLFVESHVCAIDQPVGILRVKL